MKVIVGIGVLVVATLGLIVWGVMEGEQAAVELEAGKTYYFYGETCPHCIKVNEFLETNKVAEKVAFDKLEVWRNRANARLMQRAADICQLDSKNVGVPFVYSEGKCLVGEPDVVKFFKEKAGIE